MTHSPTPDPIRVILTGLDSPYRATIRSYLDAADDLRLVAETENGQELLALAAAHHPHIILLDMQLLGLNSLAVLRRLPHVAPHTAAVVLSALGDDQRVCQAMQAGARGYLLHGLGQACLRQAIQTAVCGQTVFCATLSARLPHLFARLPSAPARPSAFSVLTPCEQRVAELLVQGWRNREMAEELMITEKSVQNYVSTILKKLAVDNRQQALLVLQQGGGHLTVASST